jgi:uncharacterized protein (DUF305 family)
MNNTNALQISVGLIAGFIIGFLITTTIGVKSTITDPISQPLSMEEMMAAMNSNLIGKTGAEFDEAFLHEMIMHHEGAVEMARLALTSTGRKEILDLSQEIITAQEAEIALMKKWLNDWGFDMEHHQH